MPAHAAEAAGGLVEEGLRVRAQQCAGDRACQTAQHPAQNDRIADGDAQRTQQGNPAENGADHFFAPGAEAVFVSADGAGAGQTAHAELSGKAYPAEQEGEQQIGNQKGGAAILAHPIGEHPDVAQAHRRAHAGDHKADGRTEAPVLVAGGVVLTHD